MADPVFALSPIAARGAMPGEEDYDAIREAFMETSRGRWFLTEYAKRNRNADTTLVLDAVARLEQGLAAQKQEQEQRDRIGDTIVAVAALLVQTRSEAEALLAVTQTPTEDSAALKGVRVLREMSWKLRESGNDARIPNMLERQATAIEDGLKAAIGADTRDKMLALLDRLANEVAALAREDAPSRQESVQQRDPVATPAAEPAKAKASAAEQFTTADVKSAVAGSRQDESRIQHAPAGEVRVEDTAAFNEALLDIPDEAEVAAGNAELTWDDAPIGAAGVQPVEMPLAQPVAAAQTAPAPEPVKISADAVGSPPTINPQQGTQSLGESLIAKGIVPKPDAPRGDALAPFKRMTQAERIAFFS